MIKIGNDSVKKLWAADSTSSVVPVKALFVIEDGVPRKIWPPDSGISSCFGAGYWINNLPWSESDPWKD